jgi:hypothetical protein
MIIIREEFKDRHNKTCWDPSSDFGNQLEDVDSHPIAYSFGEKLEKTNVDTCFFRILFPRTTVARTAVRRSFWLGHDQFWRTHNRKWIAISV